MLLNYTLLLRVKQAKLSLSGLIKLFTNPSPFIPLPFIRGEGREFVKGAKSLLIPLLSNLRLDVVYLGKFEGTLPLQK